MCHGGTSPKEKLMKFIEQVSRLFIRSDKNPPLSQELNGLSIWLSVSLLAVLNWKLMPIQ
jgi:hypothetical protein